MSKTLRCKKEILDFLSSPCPEVKNLFFGCSLIYLESGEIKEMISLIKNCVHIQHLKLKLEKIFGIDWLDHLQKFKDLKSLDIEGNNITYPGWDKLGKFIRENKTITHLNVSNTEIKDWSLQALGFALETNKTLEALDLSENTLRDFRYDGFNENLLFVENFLISMGKTVLKSLNLSKTYISPSHHNVLLASIGNMMSLTLLDISGNNFGDHLVSKIILSVPKTLKVLNIKNTYSENRTLLGIIEFVKTNNNLVCVEAGENFFKVEKPEEIARIVGSLINNQTLRTFVLGCRLISDETIIAMIEGIQENVTLSRIFLQGRSDIINETDPHLIPGQPVARRAVDFHQTTQIRVSSVATRSAMRSFCDRNKKILQAVMTIQRSWILCRYNPEYEMCKKVLLNNLDSITY